MDRKITEMLVKKGIQNACLVWAKNELDGSGSNLYSASCQAYENIMREGQKLGFVKKTARYDRAIRKKEEKDGKTYRNAATAYLTLTEIFEGEKPGKKEMKTAAGMEEYFKKTYYDAADEYRELYSSRDPKSLLLYGRMMHMLEQAARKKLIRLFSEPTGVLAGVLAITAFFIKDGLPEEESGRITRKMCEYYYDELNNLRCNVEMIAGEASSQLQKLLAESIKGERSGIECAEEVFAADLSASGADRIRADMFIDRHIHMCRFVLSI